jgi:hypothetical protein
MNGNRTFDKACRLGRKSDFSECNSGHEGSK